LKEGVAELGREATTRGIAVTRGAEEDAPAVAGVVLVDSHRLELIEFGVQQVLQGSGPGTGSKLQIECRVSGHGQHRTNQATEKNTDERCYMPRAGSWEVAAGS
jgi:hypothetical protein